MHYHGSSSKSLQSSYTNAALYAKLSYPIKALKPYLLIGYGINTISNLNGSDRVESSIQYGIGISYKPTNKVSIFADYIRAYNNKGFDGRAMQDRLRANLVTIGATYTF